MNYSQLHQAVQSAAGLRLRFRLQPLYGQGEVVFPCTVAGGKYQISKRRIPGYEQSVECAILDSVHSQANRMEEALLADIRAGNIHLPHVATDFSGIKDRLIKEIGEITCFDAPHRVFDAILRDSVDQNGKHFPLTPKGDAVIKATSHNASAIFEVSPASLLFGSWDSTGVSGGLGEKFARCVVSEVVGVNVERAVREGTRIDPLNVSSDPSIAEILAKTKDPLWTDLQKSRKNFKKASDINHSSVPWKHKEVGDAHGGVTCDYIQQSTTISCPAIRQLGFPASDRTRSAHAHTVLAAMALHAATLNVERGWHLRSRCDLVLEEGASAEWELLGSRPERRAFTSTDTRNLLQEAIQNATGAGLPWHRTPIKLIPSPALVELVIKSQEAHRASPNAE